MTIFDAWGWQQYFMAGVLFAQFAINLVRDGAKDDGKAIAVVGTLLSSGLITFVLISGGFFG